MSVKIRYQWSGDGRVPAHEEDIVDSISATATDDEIMDAAVAGWEGRADYSPPCLRVLNRAEVIKSVRAEMARRAAEGGES